jgi:hypothetical protein
VSRRKKLRARIQGNIETSNQGQYRLDPSIKALLRPTETEVEVDAYFNDLALCVELGICADCGEPVIFDEEYRDEHIKEYGISALCKLCQIKEFGE